MDIHMLLSEYNQYLQILVGVIHLIAAWRVWKVHAYSFPLLLAGLSTFISGILGVMFEVGPDLNDIRRPLFIIERTSHAILALIILRRVKLVTYVDRRRQST